MNPPSAAATPLQEAASVTMRPARGRMSPALPGSLDPQRDRLRFCIGVCQADRPEAGGVETSPGRFRCANCWAAFQARMKFR
ncbi:hypothetical protein [Rhodoferax sp. BAB1]|uniref:hypothetical protein n=1 Tax=Rhodoferax sp. BAB1 TaxID=2741720 RepID=UPI001576F627|nr:hypothetical protein [Rhodoferax sp. BAB1]QKO23611.1 hypothetical protein HTY51_17755 [Rhodoferax sp. BAB1]